MPPTRRLDEVLASVADVLFPADRERVIDINSRSCEGDSPLHVLAWRKDNFGAELLIAAGADVNVVGDMGETPLHVALSQQNREMVQSLLRAGARVDLCSDFGQTARDKSAQVGISLAVDE